MIRHRPVTMGHRGMVAAAHSLASLAGIDVLRSGGNAIDAAIAVNAALNVTQPGACGIGGDLFALIYMANEGRVRFLNGSGRTPEKATAKGLASDGFSSVRGIRSVTVPGCVDAWFTMHERYGTMPMADLLTPAVALARDGHPISHKMASAIAATYSGLNPHDSWSEVFAPGGRPPAPGERFKQPDLANSLELIAREGRRAFYEGPIADAIVSISDELGGWFTKQDLARHRSDWGEPISTKYRGYDIFETPPNTQGLTALIALRVIEHWPIYDMRWSDPKRVHVMVEAMKAALAERDRHIADPEFYNVPVDELLSEAHIARLRSGIDPNWASSGHQVPPYAAGTTYFAIADAKGNLVSCVQSLFKGFGALVVPRGTGISLHNRGAYFSFDPVHPNFLKPRKRPFHTLIASMAFKNGKPVLVFGTMGGDGQPQTHQQVFSNIFDHGMDIQTAIEAPRWVLRPGGGGDRSLQLAVENRFDPALRDQLKQMGHPVCTLGPFEDVMGHAQGIMIGDDVYFGGADPRGDGYALGW